MGTGLWLLASGYLLLVTGKPKAPDQQTANNDAKMQTREHSERLSHPL